MASIRSIGRRPRLQDIIAHVADFIARHGIWAGPIVGVLAFGESLAIVGLLIPATTLMLAVGGLIGAGLVEAVPVVLGTIVGAVIGDWVSYEVGRRIGHRAYYRWPLNRHRGTVAKTRLFFRRYGFVSILFGRFLGPIRATVPLVAGIMGMGPRPFQIANILSAIFWAPSLLVPGYIAARSMGPIEQLNEGHIAAFGLGMTVMTFAGMGIAGWVLGGGKRRERVAR
ncbi:DedA family protein [Sphingomonas naphthae]|uniref:DedA family protein n=1 Tax=Sphingomonas naphthae TaxID=1813468 RepID=A0ABY7TGD4_9SPHN|nr:DedA family protein [Sphingomonas naphthae]WCT72287.1 DedA family protein [Sphingomonas naphthae]